MILLLVAGLAVWRGGLLFAALVAVGAALILREWRALTSLKPMVHFAALAILASGLALAITDVTLNGFLIAATVILGGGVLLALISRGRGLGLIYAGVPAVALLWIRALPWGLALVVWILAVVIATDVFAYFTGRAIGGRKLAPRISPGKTWAGLVGGVVAAGITGWLVASWFNLPSWLAVSGGLMAILAQAGDLFESWLKRRAGVKDSGSILPGHGGVMDRVDGLLPVAVAVTIGIIVGMTS